MTDVIKVLGQVAPSATTATTLYTVPDLTLTTVSSLVVCNRSGSGVTYRVSVRVAGAGAVIAVAMAGLGIVEVTDFGFAKTAKQVEEHREYFTNILHPAMSRSNWLGENYSDMTGKEPPEWIKKK